MAITVSQKLNNVYDNAYDDDITVNEVPKGLFPACINNILPDGSNTREITIELIPLEQSEGGTMAANPGLYQKGENETEVKVTVKKDGSEVAETTTAY